VRDIIEDNIRSHLLWLEVFGVFLGMLFAGAATLLQNFFQIDSPAAIQLKQQNPLA